MRTVFDGGPDVADRPRSEDSVAKRGSDDMMFCEACGLHRDQLGLAGDDIRMCPDCDRATCTNCWNQVAGACLACRAFALPVAAAAAPKPEVSPEGRACGGRLQGAQAAPNLHAQALQASRKAAGRPGRHADAGRRRGRRRLIDRRSGSAVRAHQDRTRHPGDRDRLDPRRQHRRGRLRRGPPARPDDQPCTTPGSRPGSDRGPVVGDDRAHRDKHPGTAARLRRPRSRPPSPPALTSVARARPPPTHRLATTGPAGHRRRPSGRRQPRRRRPARPRPRQLVPPPRRIRRRRRHLTRPRPRHPSRPRRPSRRSPRRRSRRIPRPLSPRLNRAPNIGG